MNRPTAALLSACLAPALVALAVPARAQPQGQDGQAPRVFVQAGGNRDGVDAPGVGLAWPLDWKRAALGGEFSAHAELYGSYWRARNFAGGHQGFWHLGLVPMLRYRLAGGSSPWFVEGGIGVSATHRRYVTPDKVFSTRLNFSDNLAVGRNFGPGWNQELSLRLQHISNAGLRKPNPGEDFLIVRYGWRY